MIPLAQKAPPKSYNAELANNIEFVRKVMEVAMEESSHPKVDEWADKLWVQGGAKAIFDFCHHTVKYCKDNILRDTIRYPHVLLERVEGTKYPHKILEQFETSGATAADCDCKVALLGAMLMNRGYPVRLVGAHHIQANETPEERAEINHVYLEFKPEDDKEVWIPLEPSSKSEGWGRVAPGVMPLHRILARMNGEIIQKKVSVKTDNITVKKKVSKEGKMRVRISNLNCRGGVCKMVGAFIVTKSELDTYKQFLPTWVHPDFRDAYNEAYRVAGESPEQTVDIDLLASRGKIMLERYINKIRSLEMALRG